MSWNKSPKVKWCLWNYFCKFFTDIKPSFIINLHHRLKPLSMPVWECISSYVSASFPHKFCIVPNKLASLPWALTILLYFSIIYSSSVSLIPTRSFSAIITTEVLFLDTNPKPLCLSFTLTLALWAWIRHSEWPSTMAQLRLHSPPAVFLPNGSQRISLLRKKSLNQ